MNTLAKKNARSEIALHIDKLLAEAPPKNEVERARRLDLWEQVGNAVREYFAGDELRDQAVEELKEIANNAVPTSSDVDRLDRVFQVLS